MTLAQTLNILERFPLIDARDPSNAHLVIEALRRGFQDRMRYLGDSDFVAVPVARLVDKAYARSRAASIDPAAATPNDALTVGMVAASESYNTTHYSIIDAEGNRVGATLSINSWFGGGVVAGDTGVLLNNEMDDFSLRADLANSYLLRGDPANGIAPHKRPLSSMSPTFVEDGKGVLVLGAPGGSRIISMVLFGILDYVNQSAVDLQRIVAAPRLSSSVLARSGRDRARQFYRGMARGAGSEGAPAAGREPQMGQYAGGVQIEARRIGAGGERSARARHGRLLGGRGLSRQRPQARL